MQVMCSKTMQHGFPRHHLITSHPVSKLQKSLLLCNFCFCKDGWLKHQEFHPNFGSQKCRLWSIQPDPLKDLRCLCSCDAMGEGRCWFIACVVILWRFLLMSSGESQSTTTKRDNTTWMNKPPSSTVAFQSNIWKVSSRETWHAVRPAIQEFDMVTWWFKIYYSTDYRF